MKGLRIITYTRIFLWLSAFVLFGWIVWANLMPTGSVTLHCSAEACNPQIRNFASKEADVLIGTTKRSEEPFRLITVDPLYFDVKVFRPLRRATIRLVYQNPNQQERLNIGMHEEGGYTFFPLASHSARIADLLKNEDWKNIRSGDDILFFRDREGVQGFDDLQSFFRSMPDTKRVASYGVDLNPSIPLPEGGADTPVQFPVSIRGATTLYTFVESGEALDVTMTFQEINRHAGSDDVSVRIARDGEIIETRVIPDDGDALASGAPSAMKELHIRRTDLLPGTYRIDIIAQTDDPFLHSVTTGHSRLMFQGRLFLGGSEEYAALGEVEKDPVTLYLKGTRLSLRAPHESALQTITVGNQNIALQEVGKTVTVKLSKEQSKQLIPIQVPIRDVVLETDGYFALSQDHFFTLDRGNIEAFSSGDDLEKYDYVYARYPEVTQLGDWLVAERTIEAETARRDFSFIIVGDPALGGSGRTLKVRDLFIRLEGDPLTLEAVKGYLPKFFQKFRSGTL